MFESITKRFKKKPEEYYCQYCGENLTEEGGVIASNGKIYCAGFKPGKGMRCLDKDIIVHPTTKNITTQFYEPEDVQKAIERKELTQFGPLEKEINNE